jgi:hypothetical protein
MQSKFQYLRVEYTIRRDSISLSDRIKIHSLFINGKLTTEYTDINLFYESMGMEGWDIKSYSVYTNSALTIEHVIFQKQIS